MTTSMERTSKTNDCDEGEREEMLEEGLEKNVMLYHYVSGIVGMTYNPFINEDIRDCYFDYDQAELLISWLPKISTKRSIASQKVNLGLVLKERVTASSMPKTDNRVEFGLDFSDKLLRTSVMVAWGIMKASWCPIPNTYLILRATQVVQRELIEDCSLNDLNVI